MGKTGTVADIMAGTGTVALELRKAGYSVIASDVMTYSYHHLMVNLCLDSAPSFSGLVNHGAIGKNEVDAYGAVLTYLNCIEPKEGFSSRNFLRVEHHRMVATRENISLRKMQRKLMRLEKK